jgi:hypothetical protein
MAVKLTQRRSKHSRKWLPRSASNKTLLRTGEDVRDKPIDHAIVMARTVRILFNIPKLPVTQPLRKRVWTKKGPTHLCESVGGAVLGPAGRIILWFYSK